MTLPSADPTLTARLIAFLEAYARCIDDDELEQWPGFFSDACVYKITTRQNLEAGYAAGVAYADSKGMLNDRVKSIRQVNIYEAQRYRHVLSLPHIQSQDANGTLHVRTGFIVIRIMHTGETSIFATGSYHDRVGAQAERLVLHERIVVCDSPRFDTLLALPL